MMQVSNDQLIALVADAIDNAHGRYNTAKAAIAAATPYIEERVLRELLNLNDDMLRFGREEIGDDFEEVWNDTVRAFIQARFEMGDLKEAS
jgi:hypothetical protein